MPRRASVRLAWALWAALAGSPSLAAAAEPARAILVARGEVPTADSLELAAAIGAAGAFVVIGYVPPPAGYAHPEERAALERARAMIAEGEKLYFDLRYEDAVKRLRDAREALIGGPVPVGEAADLIRADGFRAAAELALKRKDDAAATIRALLRSWRDAVFDEKVFSPPVIELAESLRSELDPGATGSIVLASSPSGVPLYVDGLRRGDTGARPAGGLSVGKHDVVVWRAELAAWRTEVEITPGVVVTLSAPLGPQSVDDGDSDADALAFGTRAGVDAALVVETAKRAGLPYVTVTAVSVHGGAVRFGGAPARDAAGLFALARYLAGGPADPPVTTSPSEFEKVAPRSSLERRIGLVALAIGAGAVAVSFGIGAGAINNAAAGAERYDTGMEAAGVRLRRSAERLGDIATGLFIAGAALAIAGGVVVVLYPGKKGGAGKLEAAPAPGGASLRVTLP